MNRVPLLGELPNLVNEFLEAGGFSGLIVAIENVLVVLRSPRPIWLFGTTEIILTIFPALRLRRQSLETTSSGSSTRIYRPLIWMLEVKGFLMDIRHCPREAQAVAFKKGLIPYIPADQNGT